ncbi:MAG: leucine-rich repeat domain-containing protein [Lachnospiraceae bacterium]|nr:leucine-rich repeat domain-containing protein [Lachnospiraceae bacterium]
MQEENRFCPEPAEENEMEYFYYEGNRFLIDRGVLKDVLAESRVVRVPERVKEIRRQAFLDARLEGRIEVLFIPASVKKIERLTFAGMPRLQQVELQASIVTLEQGMFRNCMELERIILPHTLRVIESRAFEGCLKLFEVQLPRVYVQISEDAFLKCVSLKDSRIERAIADESYKRRKEEEEARRARFPHLNTEVQEEQKTEEKEEFPAEEILKETLLAEQSGMYVPPAQQGENTKEAQFCIYEGVLERCEVYGSSLVIPEGVTALSDRVLYGMEQLTDIAFPSTLSYIGRQALEGTGWIKKERENNTCVVVNGILISAFYESLVMEAKLPETIRRIAPYAFHRSGAKLVILPESLQEIDAYAFVDCEVTEIDFPRKPDVVIHTPLAVRCSQLNELYFQGKTERLEDNFVRECPALKRVCLKWPQTVVQKNAFPENVRIWII